MDCIGGADRTFACKSQECLWQDWYISVFKIPQMWNLPAGQASSENCLLARKEDSPQIFGLEFNYNYKKCVKMDSDLFYKNGRSSLIIMVRIEKKWHIQESKPVLQDGLDPIFVLPYTFLSVSGGKMGIIWNTAQL